MRLFILAQLFLFISFFTAMPSEAAPMDGAMPIFTELLSGKISQNINDDLEQCQLLADPAQKISIFTGQATSGAKATANLQAINSLFSNALMQAEAEAAISINSDITASNNSNSAQNQESNDDESRLDQTDKQQILSTQSALAQSLGLIVLRSFLAHNSDKSMSAGVCLLRHPNLPNLAEAMAHNDRNSLQNIMSNGKSPTANLATYYLGHKQELPAFFGLRLVWGAEGLPVILSFVSTKYAANTLSPSMKAMMVKNYVDMLTTEADTQIAHFIAGATNVTRGNESSSDYALEASLTNGTAQEKLSAVKKFTDTINQKLDYKGLRGVSTVLRWTLADPDNKSETIGIIRQWNPW